MPLPAEGNESIYAAAAAERESGSGSHFNGNEEKRMKISTRTIVTVGMFTAVLSVLSILTIPMPTGVPVTLQTFAVALCGYVLGAKRGTASAALYLLIGTVGVPVFAGMTGGPSWLVSYSGGFLWGFLFLAALCGLGVGRRALFCLAPGFAGLAVYHLCGVLQFSVVASTPFPASFLAVSMPYLLKDAVSVAGAYVVSLPIRRALSSGKLLEDGSKAGCARI